MITFKLQWPSQGPLISIGWEDADSAGIRPSYVAPLAPGALVLKEIAAGSRLPTPVAPPAPSLFATALPYILPLLCAGDSPVREETPLLPKRPVEWQPQRFSEHVGSLDLYRQMGEHDRERQIETEVSPKYRGDRTTLKDAPVVLPADTPPAIALPESPVPTVENATMDVPRHSTLPVVERYTQDPEALHKSDPSTPYGTTGIRQDLMHDALTMGAVDFLTQPMSKRLRVHTQPPQFLMSTAGKSVYPEDTIRSSIVLPTIKRFHKMARGEYFTVSDWHLIRLSDRVGYYANEAGDKGFVLDPGVRYDGEAMLFLPQRVARKVVVMLEEIQVNLPTHNGTLSYVVGPIGHDEPFPLVSELEIEVLGPQPILVRMPWTSAYLKRTPLDYHPLHHSPFKDLAPADWVVHTELTHAQTVRAATTLEQMWLNQQWPSGHNEDLHQFMLPVMAAALRDRELSESVKTILVSMLIHEGDTAFRYLTTVTSPSYHPQGDGRVELDDRLRGDLELNVWALYRFFPSLHDTQSLFPRYRPAFYE